MHQKALSIFIEIMDRGVNYSYFSLMNGTDANLKELYWIKDAFTLNYSIFEAGKIIGQITDKSFNRTAKASIFGRKFVFEREGFL